MSTPDMIASRTSIYAINSSHIKLDLRCRNRRLLTISLSSESAVWVLLPRRICSCSIESLPLRFPLCLYQSTLPSDATTMVFTLQLRLIPMQHSPHFSGPQDPIKVPINLGKEAALYQPTNLVAEAVAFRTPSGVDYKSPFRVVMVPDGAEYPNRDDISEANWDRLFIDMAWTVTRKPLDSCWIEVDVT